MPWKIALNWSNFRFSSESPLYFSHLVLSYRRGISSRFSGGEKKKKLDSRIDIELTGNFWSIDWQLSNKKLPDKRKLCYLWYLLLRCYEVSRLDWFTTRIDSYFISWIGLLSDRSVNRALFETVSKILEGVRFDGKLENTSEIEEPLMENILIGNL